MRYTLFGFSVKKALELKIDMKDLALLRDFVDFRETGKMKAEIINGKTYYWVNYNYLAKENPLLELSKRSVMLRMLKLKDAGILTHITKKEGGTFSFFALGPKYIELISTDKSDNSENIEEAEDIKESEKNDNSVHQNVEGVHQNVEGVHQNVEGVHQNVEGVHQNEQGVCFEMNTGCASKCTPKINLLKDSSTKETNIKKYKKDIEDIVNYLNEVVNANYKPNFKNTVQLITARLNDGYEVNDFKTVINKKAKEWRGTQFEQYLTPQTLFGNKFEQYLNQKIIKPTDGTKEKTKLRFDNFKGRDYDYDALEKKLLGWE